MTATVVVNPIVEAVVAVNPIVETVVAVNPIVETVVQVFPAGLRGESVDPANYFQTTNRFSELDTEQKKTEARQNLELQYIDCGEFF